VQSLDKVVEDFISYTQTMHISQCHILLVFQIHRTGRRLARKSYLISGCVWAGLNIGWLKPSIWSLWGTLILGQMNRPPLGLFVHEKMYHPQHLWLILDYLFCHSNSKKFLNLTPRILFTDNFHLIILHCQQPIKKITMRANTFLHIKLLNSKMSRSKYKTFF
jgi:hypothetical protein